MKWLRFTLFSSIVAAAAVTTAVKLGSWETRRLAARVDELERERERLLDVVARLSAVRRVAQVDVVRQRADEQGRTITTVLWQEIGPDGTLGRPVAYEAVGSLVYFEALVLKFAHQHVAEGDAQRGASLALFRRIFGDQQSPESGALIDRAAAPPRLPGSAHVSAELWSKFWQFVDDPALARHYGVRVAQVEAPAVPLQPGQVWEVSLDAAGGLNVRRLTDRAVQRG